MQGDKSTMSSVMEAAANVAASAKSGLDKTKAVVEEKVAAMSTSDEVEKDMAALRKEEKIDLAELRKCKAYAQNAVAAAAPAPNSPSFTDGGNFSTIGSFDTPITSTDTVDQSRPAVGSETGIVGSENAPDSNGEDISRTQVVDSNPTHTGMPAPVVQPSTGGSVYSSGTNTGSDIGSN